MSGIFVSNELTNTPRGLPLEPKSGLLTPTVVMCELREGMKPVGTGPPRPPPLDGGPPPRPRAGGPPRERPGAILGGIVGVRERKTTAVAFIVKFSAAERGVGRFGARIKIRSRTSRVAHVLTFSFPMQSIRRDLSYRKPVPVYVPTPPPSPYVPPPVLDLHPPVWAGSLAGYMRAYLASSCLATGARR